VPWTLFDIQFALPVYALVLFRVSGLALAAPVFSSRVIPGRVRAALVITLAAMLFPLVASQAPRELSWSGAIVGAAGEMMIGLTIGLCLALFVFGVEVAGLMVGRQAGLALGEVFDPNTNNQGSIMGQVYTISLMTLFLLVGGHRATVAALLDTYTALPLLSFRMDESIVMLLVDLLTAAFVLGIRVAGPVLIAMFLIGTAMGVLSRTMPQFNILSVGFTVRVLVAIGVAGFALAGCQDLFLDAIWSTFETVRTGLGMDPYPVGLVS